MMALQIASPEKFENNRTKAIERLRWIPIPNTTDDDAYLALTDGDDGPAAFGAYVAILMLASRSDTRWLLVRGTGSKMEPHTAASIARAVRMPVESVEIALQRAKDAGLIIEIDWDGSRASGERQAHDAGLPKQSADNGSRASGRCAQSTMELKGIEGNGIEGAAHTSPPAGGGGRRAAAMHSHTAEVIYLAYPRHVGKRDALKAIHKAAERLSERGIKNPAEYLLDAVKAYAASPQGRSKPATDDKDFRPHPATWFSGDRFDDDPAEWEKASGSASKSTHDPRKADSAQVCQGYAT